MKRKITDVMDVGSEIPMKKVAEQSAGYDILSTDQIDEKVKQLEQKMMDHAQNLEFEQAAATRDKIAQLRQQQLAT